MHSAPYLDKLGMSAALFHAGIGPLRTIVLSIASLLIEFLIIDTSVLWRFIKSPIGDSWPCVMSSKFSAAFSYESIVE